MILPLAHVGHYLWVFYLVPVLIVIGGILYSTISGRRASRGDHDSAPTSSRAEERRPDGDPPAGG